MERGLGGEDDKKGGAGGEDDKKGGAGGEDVCAENGEGVRG